MTHLSAKPLPKRARKEKGNTNITCLPSLPPPKSSSQIEPSTVSFPLLYHLFYLSRPCLPYLFYFSDFTSYYLILLSQTFGHRRLWRSGRESRIRGRSLLEGGDATRTEEYIEKTHRGWSRHQKAVTRSSKPSLSLCRHAIPYKRASGPSLFSSSSSPSGPCSGYTRGGFATLL